MEEIFVTINYGIDEKAIEDEAKKYFNKHKQFFDEMAELITKEDQSEETKKMLKEHVDQTVEKEIRKIIKDHINVEMVHKNEKKVSEDEKPQICKTCVHYDPNEEFPCTRHGLEVGPKDTCGDWEEKVNE